MEDRCSAERLKSKREAEATLSEACGRLAELFPDPRSLPEIWPVSIEPHPSPGRRSSPREPRVRVLPEDLLRPPMDLLVVLLHGMVHYANALAGVKDCSRGHYHNRQFRDLAAQVGLEVENSKPRFGWAAVMPEASLLEQLADMALPKLPRLRSPQPAAVPGRLEDRDWRCGLNLGDGPPDSDWRVAVPPPKVPRFRVQLVREEGIPWHRYPKLQGLPEAVTLCWQLLKSHQREAVAVLFLDNRRRLIGYDVPYVGSLTKADVEPRGVLLPALLVNAASVVVAHNHPSGDPIPSDLDYQQTKMLMEAGEILGVSVWASLIVAGRDQWHVIKPEQDTSLQTLLRGKARS